MNPRLSTIPAAAATDPRLSPLDVRILSILGREMYNQGFARANRRQIAEWAQCGASSVPRSIAKMEKLGYVERRAAFNGKVQSANEYRVKLDQPLEYVADTRLKSDTHDVRVTGIPQDTPQILRFECADTRTNIGRGIPEDTGILVDTGIRRGIQKEIPPTPPKEKTTPSKRPPKGGPKGSPNPAGFDEAWALWPKHHRQSSKPISVQRWNRIGAEPEKLLAAIRAYLASPEAKKTTPDGVAGGFVNAFEVWLNKYAEFWLERTASIVPAHSDADLRAARIAWAKAKHDWRAEWGSPDPEVLPFLKAQGAAP